MTAEHDAIWAVIPVKPLHLGKSRLDLAPAERVALNRTFLTHVLRVTAERLAPSHTVVVSRDPAVHAIARRSGARALDEGDDCDLNDALALGAGYARQRGASAILSLFTDIPFLIAADLSAMLDAHRAGEVVLAPDEDGTGTNAMLMAPSQLPYRHGVGSLWRHLEAVREARLCFALVKRPGLMRDIDTPADHAAFLAHCASAALG